MGGHCPAILLHPGQVVAVPPGETEGMKTSTKVGLLLILILGSYSAFATWRLKQSQLQVYKEIGARQKAVLEANGWKVAKEASEKQMAVTVPALEEELKAAREQKAPIIIGGRTITKAVPFAVPCDLNDVAASGIAAGGEENPRLDTTPQPSSPPVTITADSQVAITALANGSIAWTQRLFATVSRGTWHETKELPADTSTVNIDPKLTKAWQQFVQGPKTLWELRASAVLGSAYGIRLGGSWIGRGQHFGLSLDFDKTWSSETTCSYYESCSSDKSSDSSIAAGVAIRF